MDKLKVSIGIPAYNEEANIKQLLENLLIQKQDNYELLEIIVASDGSSDNTVELTNSLKDARIKVLDNKDRKGQAERQNQILDMYSGEVLVLLNADILPKNDSLIESLINPLRQNSNVALVSCKNIPVSSESFVGKVVDFSTGLKDAMVERLNGGDNVYNCHGSVRAFSRKFTQQFRWPVAVGEDAYSYFKCKELGYGFCYVPTAAILYRSPQTLQDHFKQSVRFRGSQELLQKEFPSETLSKFYVIPRTIFVASVLRSAFLHPIYTMAYVCFQLVGLLNPFRVKQTNIWEPSSSSKTII